MRTGKLALIALALATLVPAARGGPLRYPNLGGGQIRLENHLLPAVSTGPLDPAWSPDGRFLAFSLRGDIWKVPAEGGEAVALTEGPGYHFEPAWSPDGKKLALTVDGGGNLDIALVSSEGGPLEPLTTDPHVDVQPAFSPDGKEIYFVTGRAGNLDIYRLDLATRSESPLVSTPQHEIQPAVSPDGGRLLFIAPVEGRLGSGGIWVKPLPAGEPKLVHYEETSYRAKPSWAPGGERLVYVSDVAGSNDVVLLPAEGGNPLRLTWDDRDEYAPVVSPDGSRIAFVSNRGGPTTLFTAPFGGGLRSDWTPVAIRSRRARKPTGRLRGTVQGLGGEPTPARIQLVASDGRAYSPDGGFHRVIAVSETHYFHARGEFEVELPAGRVEVEALKGFEYLPAQARLEVPAGGTAETTLRLSRLVDAPARGWFSADTHVHDLHQGRFGLTQEDLFYQGLAEDLRVSNPLIHMDGTNVMGRLSDLTGKPHPLSNVDYVLQYGEEFRGALGHVALIGITRFILPFIGGAEDTGFSGHLLNASYLDRAREQGGIGGFLHPYNSRVSEPRQAAGSEIPIDVALGKGDFFDVACIWSDELASAEMYYRFLNSGVRLAATGGSDNFSNVWRDPPIGTGRTYARLEGALSFEAFLAAVKAGRTFGTNGPLLFLEVEGKGPGEEIRIAAGDRRALPVRVEAFSLAPLETLEIVVNGEVAHRIPASADRTRVSAVVSLPLPAGGWIAARVSGAPHRYLADSYPFAQTSPVYVVRGDRRFTSSADARFLQQVVEEIGRRAETSRRWRSEGERKEFREAVEKASAFYRAVAESGGSTPPQP
jgi:TolB protein